MTTKRNLIILFFINVLITLCGINIEYIGKIDDIENNNIPALYEMYPYFIDNEYIIYSKNKNEIYKYNVIAKNKEKIELQNVDKVKKIGDRIYLIVRDKTFIINKGKIAALENNDLPIKGNIYFNYQKGFLNKYNNKEEIIIPNMKDGVKTIFSFPFYNHGNNYIFYNALNEKYKNTTNTQLKCYNIETKKIDVITDNIIAVSVIPSNPDNILLYTFSVKFELLAREFILLNIKSREEIIIDNKTVKNFFLLSLDVSENNNIVALSEEDNYYGIYLLKLSGLQSGKADVKKEIKKIYVPTIPNLRLRDAPVNGRTIRLINESDRLELIEKDKEDTIDGIKGIWLKVKTDRGEVGWCFSGYLREVK